jgi:hypothetical protein
MYHTRRFFDGKRFRGGNEHVGIVLDAVFASPGVPLVK